MVGPSSADISWFEGFRLDRRGGVLSRRDENGDFIPMAISSRALDILGVLVEWPGDLVSRDKIINAVWPGTVVEDSNLNVQVAALRRILDQDRGQGSCIQTVPGRGYRFVAAVTRSGAEPSQSGLRPPPRLSIVVLPFTNLSNDPEQQYFADGITEDLTTDLSRLAGMLVISRNTAFSYRNKSVDTRQIGRELGVRYVLEGSVRRLGNQLRVNAQLIDAETDTHLWAERFNGDTSELLALQDEVTSQIAVALNLELIYADVARPAETPNALDYILRGRAAAAMPHARDKYAEVVAMFERALALDPRSVEAQSRLAIALTARVLDQMTGSRAADIASAEALIRQISVAAPRSPLTHFAKGQILRVQRRYLEAIPEYEAAITLNRNWVTAFAALAECQLYSGLVDSIIPLHERLIRLSPRDPDIAQWYFRIGVVHLLQSRIDEAIVWLEKARSGNAELPYAHSHLASAYALKGENKRAAIELAEARRLSGDDRYSSFARLRALQYWGVPKIRALYEATYFTGLRKAGMAEE